MADTGLIEAASGQCKTMADGTLRVVFDIEPRFAATAFALFSAPGTPAVLGRLQPPVAEPAPTVRAPAVAPQAKRERMEPLCEWAVMRCGEAQFQQWAWQQIELLGMAASANDKPAEVAAAVIKRLCRIESRKELDVDPIAAKSLHEFVRKPYLAWLMPQKDIA